MAFTLLPMHALFWDFLRRRSLSTSAKWIAGVFCGLCGMKPQYLPFLLLPAIAVGGWRCVTGFVLCVIALVLASCLAFGYDNVASFPAALLSAQFSSSSGLQVSAMQNLRGLLCVLTRSDSQIVHIICSLALCTALLLLGWLWFLALLKLRGRFADAIEYLAAITVLIGLGFSLHTHFGDYLLAAISCVFLWNNDVIASAKTRFWLRLLLLLLPGITWLYFLTRSNGIFLCSQMLVTWDLLVLAVAVSALPLAVSTAEK